MSAVLFIRIKSDLELNVIQRRMLERKPKFLEVPGLLQKIYGRDPSTGDLCGIYFFESQDALEAYLESDLAKSIPSTYGAKEVRREMYEVLFPLRPGQGPVE